MCEGAEKKCFCGASIASIHNESELPYDVLVNVWCPECSKHVEIEKDNMVQDNGWIIEYDMEIVEVYHNKLDPDCKNITPELIFDKRWSCWTGHTPTDVEDKIKESLQITKLAKKDPKAYFKEIKLWNKERVERLKKEGWRKLTHSVM